MFKVIVFIVVLFLISFCPLKKSNNNPKLIKLKISECIEDCKDPDKIFSEEFKDSTYILNFGMLLNCCDQDTIKLKFKSDTLKIKITSRTKYIIKKINGKSDTTVLYSKGDCECDCYFKFDVQIKNLSLKPKFIKVNKVFLKSA